jgi:hypothetical protein
MDTYPTEMKTLIGLFILQHIVQKPENDVYFNKRESIATPYFSKVMAEKRFHLFLKFIHFADNSKFDPYKHHKKLYKIQQVLDHLKSKFSSVYTPEQNVCRQVPPPLERTTGLDSIHTIKAKQVWYQNLQAV